MVVKMVLNMVVKLWLKIAQKSIEIKKYFLLVFFFLFLDILKLELMVRFV